MTGAPLILLAPSEEKAPGGVVGPLPESKAQRWVRDRLVALARRGDPEELQKAFQVKGVALEKARAEALALKGPLPLLPALARYTGVAFKALDPARLPPETWRQVFILSNLRGLVRGDEPMPPYKLKPGAVPGLKAHWQAALRAPLQALPDGPVWELLPGESSDLLRGWVRPRHTVEIVDGEGRAISHFSKHHRGLLASWILRHQEGDPARVAKARLPGCRWELPVANDRGGMALRLVVLP